MPHEDGPLKREFDEQEAEKRRRAAERTPEKTARARWASWRHLRPKCSDSREVW